MKNENDSVYFSSEFQSFKLFNIKGSLLDILNSLLNSLLSWSFLGKFLAVVVLSKCELELSYIPTVVFNMCMKLSLFLRKLGQDYG